MAYEYSLDDLYVMFSQSDDGVALLREWSAMNLPYNINWDRLIEVWTTREWSSKDLPYKINWDRLIEVWIAQVLRAGELSQSITPCNGTKRKLPKTQISC